MTASCYNIIDGEVSSLQNLKQQSLNNIDLF